MTKDEALKMAVEAKGNYQNGWMPDEMVSALLARKEALEQPAQEPASLGDFDNMTKAECVEYIDYLRKEIDLLRFKEWQELSEDEILVIYESMSSKPRMDGYEWEYARAIEVKLKEKNHE